jgi:hypothetical protein
MKKQNSCWNWQGSLSGGYSMYSVNRTTYHVHKFIFELFMHPVPKGMHLHHKCHNKACVNPWHLEVLSPREHVRKGNNPCGINMRKKFCAHGHPFNGRNVHIYTGRGWIERRCRKCESIRKLEKYYKLKGLNKVDIRIRLEHAERCYKPR